MCGNFVLHPRRKIKNIGTTVVGKAEKILNYYGIDLCQDTPSMHWPEGPVRSRIRCKDSCASCENIMWPFPPLSSNQFLLRSPGHEDQKQPPHSDHHYPEETLAIITCIIMTCPMLICNMHLSASLGKGMLLSYIRIPTGPPPYQSMPLL